MSEFLTHPFEPFFDKDSKILILGSFPSVKSRQDGFYYQHPRNRFWPILETLFDVRLENITEYHRTTSLFKKKTYRSLGCTSKLQDKKFR